MKFKKSLVSNVSSVIKSEEGLEDEEDDDREEAKQGGGGYQQQ